MTRGDQNDARKALHDLLAGAEGCGPAAGAARRAQDDELADFLCGIQDEFAERAGRRAEGPTDRLESGGCGMDGGTAKLTARAKKLGGSSCR